LHDAAVASFQAPIAAAAPDTTAALEVAYVRLHQELDVLQHVKNHGGAFAVALPGAEGRALHAKGQDQSRQDKIKDRLIKVMVSLNLAAPLDPEGARYQSAMARLRDEEVLRVQGLVEREVSGLVAIRLERSSLGVASRNTRSLQKRAQRRRKRIRELINLLQTWQDAGLPQQDSPVIAQLPEQWTEEQIQKLFRGTYPWRGDCGEGAAALPHLAEQYRDACAEGARSQEELLLLRWERGRTIKYYEYMLKVLREASGQLEEDKDKIWGDFIAGAIHIRDQGQSRAGEVDLKGLLREMCNMHKAITKVAVQVKLLQACQRRFEGYLRKARTVFASCN